MKKLEEAILKHLQERGWDNLRPADIAKSIMIEGAELLELFQWENLSLEDVGKNKEKVEAIKSELADVLIYALELSVLLKLDAEAIIRKKLAHVQIKYPAKLMRSLKGNPGAEAEYWRIKNEYRKRKR